jgi:hypothetical protein
MIQRIQTVYLLGAIALVVLCFYFPMAEFINTSGHQDMYTLGGLTSGMAGKNFSEILAFLSGIVVGASFISVFMYKKRKRQIKACMIIIVLLILINILVFVQIAQLKQELGMVASYKLPCVFPLISAVLVFLAYRGIKKDEELVKSYDRIR